MATQSTHSHKLIEVDETAASLPDPSTPSTTTQLTQGLNNLQLTNAAEESTAAAMALEEAEPSTEHVEDPNTTTATTDKQSPTEEAKTPSGNKKEKAGFFAGLLNRSTSPRPVKASTHSSHSPTEEKIKEQVRSSFLPPSCLRMSSSPRAHFCLLSARNGHYRILLKSLQLDRLVPLLKKALWPSRMLLPLTLVPLSRPNRL